MMVPGILAVIVLLTVLLSLVEPTEDGNHSE
jgi:hypothetical protein